MKLFMTAAGLARADADELVQLDTGGADLGALLAAGRLEELARLPARSRQPLAAALASERWVSLISAPSRFVIAGLNYRAHCEEIGAPVPERLVFGFAPGSAVNASGRPVLMPPGADSMLDYEGEIGVVMARTAHNVAAVDAWDYIAGLAPLNDVSARDVQAERTREAVGRAKGFATFKPFGPALATADEFADLDAITITTWVNGEQRQHGVSGDMVFSIAEIIAIVSAEVTLLPGDVVCTGTPGGVAHGGHHPWLAAGDRVDIEIGGLPRLSNHFVRAAEAS